MPKTSQGSADPDEHLTDQERPAKMQKGSPNADADPSDHSAGQPGTSG